MLQRYFIVVLSLCAACITHANPESGLVLEISALSDRVVVGEPILLDVALTNHGTGVLSVSRELEQWGNSTRYFVSQDGVGFRELPGYLSERLTPQLSLAHDESLRHIEWILVDLGVAWSNEAGRLFLATAPGEYTFYVEYHTPLGDGSSCRITSNRVGVTVVEPEPEAHKMIDRVHSLEEFFETNPDELNGPASRHNGNEESLATLAESGTTYSPYAALILGKQKLRRLQAPGADGNREQLRGLDWIDMIRVQRDWAEPALAYLDKADVGGFPLRAEAVRGKLEAHRLKNGLTKWRVLEHTRKGAETLALMQERYPDLWFSKIEAANLEQRLLTEFPDSAAAWRLRKELETAAAPIEP